MPRCLRTLAFLFVARVGVLLVLLVLLVMPTAARAADRDIDAVYHPARGGPHAGPGLLLASLPPMRPGSKVFPHRYVELPVLGGGTVTVKPVVLEMQGMHGVGVSFPLPDGVELDVSRAPAALEHVWPGRVRGVSMQPPPVPPSQERPHTVATYQSRGPGRSPRLLSRVRVMPRFSPIPPRRP